MIESYKLIDNLWMDNLFIFFCGKVKFSNQSVLNIVCPVT